MCSAPARRWTRDDGYVITDDPAWVDLDAVHAALTRSSWSRGIPRDVVARAIAHSLSFSLLAPTGEQAGFARVVTDRATYAYLADVFVVEAHQEQGLGTWLVGCVLDHPDLQGLRRIALTTDEAHGLYGRFGFAPPDVPEQHMFLERSPEELWPR